MIYTSSASTACAANAEEPWSHALALWHQARDEHRCPAPSSSGAPTASTTNAPDDNTLWSPDGRHGLRCIGHDIALINATDGQPVARTDDGEADWAYGGWPDVGLCSVALRVNGLTPPPAARWSPDGRWAVVARTDQRRVRELVLTDPLADDGGIVEHRQRIPLPGDDHLPQTTLVLVDVQSAGFVPLAMAPLVSNYAPIVPATADPRLAALLPTDIGIVRWFGSRLIVIDEQRGWQSVRVLVIDPATRTVREVLHETAATHVQLAAQRYPAQLALLSDGSLVFYSERSGWGHLWLKPREGEPRPLTTGSWTVRELHHVDEASGRVFFSASGREPDVDPYHRLLYSVPLQGGEPCRMTLHDADHDIEYDKARGTWIATWSRVDDPGGSLELDAEGHVIHETPAAVPQGQVLERAVAKRFCVTAADGITPLYGVLYLPRRRTPGARLPLLDHVYGAPQRTQAQVRYSLSASVRPDDTQALTSLGFAVFVLDGRGTPMRGKAFHDCSWGAGHADACGLADHAVAVQQIAQQFDCIDTTRVGIFGSSGGGYAAARAVMLYPDVFHAAFAAAGNHDQRLYCARYERYVGLLPVAAPHYDAADNAVLMHRLRRPLMLAHGMLDDDVHPVATLRLAAAAQRAGKRVDLLIVPRGNHNIAALDEVLVQKWTFFCEHLQPAQDGSVYTSNPTESNP